MNRPSRYLTSGLLLILATCAQAQQLAAQQPSARQSQRPRIGLTLSGGGAKGLAHIGILKAIDSAGLKIDYLTGTSMGSIMGALYAVGYSGDSIERIARHIDWDLLLSNQSTMRSMIMEEKDEYSKYDIELPWVNHWFRISTGVIEGQELWLKLAEVFRPVYNIKDFRKFNIPFECIATDVSTGEAVVIDSGDIVSALRSSMAIPSIFTAVERNGRKLVDGGVLRNFPVRDVKSMGADIVIGSNVSGGLRSSDQVTNAIQVLLQVAFFREAEDTRQQIPLCNIYVHQSLDQFGMGSFGEANDIIQAGLEQGRRLYPQLKALVDSLDSIYGYQDMPPSSRLPADYPIKISTFSVKGLQRTTEPFFIQSMGLLTNHYYTPSTLTRMVRRAFGTRYYNRITYNFQLQDDGTSKICFEVEENPLTFAKLGLNYNQFSGISAIANVTSRDFLTPTSRSLVTLNLGQNFRMRAEHLQYFSRGGKLNFTLGTQFDQFNITTYNNRFKEEGLYNRNYLKIDGKIGYSTNRDLTFGFGNRLEWIRYDPSISSSLEFKGSNYFSTGFFFIRHNTLDRPVIPRKGTKIDAEADYVFDQSPRAQSFSTTPNRLDTSFSGKAYQRILFSLDRYTPLWTKFTFLLRAQAGINLNYNHNIMNEFSIGGMTDQFNNQITFAGLREGTFYSTSVAALQLGLRYQLFPNTFVSGRANIALNNFVRSNSSFFYTPDFLSGYAGTFTFNFPLGPLELSAMYSDQSRRVIGYINIGIPF